MDDYPTLNELSTGPLDKYELNPASFAHLSRAELLQLFNNLLVEIDPEQKIDIRYEDPSATVLRILEFLRILKYMPPGDDPNEFRKGISDGDLDVIIPIMAWIVDRKEILKKRVYLAKFLVKIELPYVMAHDDDAVRADSQYESLMEKFVTLHKENEALKNKESVSKLLENIQKFENEQECLSRKVEYMKSRHDTKTSRPLQLTNAKVLRAAHDKKLELSHQLKLEENRLRNSELKKAAAKKRLQGVINMSNAGSSETLFHLVSTGTVKLEELVNHKLPQEIKNLERKCRAFRAVELQPPETQDDTDYLKKKIASITQEVIQLESRSLMKGHNELLFIVRQKATASSRRRELMCNEARLLTNQLIELQEVRAQLFEVKALKMEEIEFKVNDFKTFLKEFKVKANQYKSSKTELDFLKSDSGVLASTKFILDGDFQDAENELEELETQMGLSGLSRTQEKLEALCSEKSFMDEQKNRILCDMSNKVRKMYEQIGARKTEIEPLVKDVNALRKESSLLQTEYDKLKTKYQKCKLEFDGPNDEIQKKIDIEKENLYREELSYLELKSRMSALKMKIKQASQEKVYQNREKNSKENRVRSLKQKMLGKIVEQERIGETLEAEMENFDEFKDKCAEQESIWFDMIRIIEWKLKSKQLQI